MSKFDRSVLPSVKQAERLAQQKRLIKRRQDPTFRELLRSMRARIGGGQSLHDIREALTIKNDRYWNDLVTSLSQSFTNPANMLLEWQIRQQSRYAMAADLYATAKSVEDKEVKFDQMSKAIMIMSKIDENALELQKALGLIQPIDDPESLGEGYADADLEAAQARFNEIVEQKIVDKLTIKRLTQPAESVAVLPRDESGGEADSVGSASLAENNADGSVP